jgi:hypothetical protein
VLFLYSCSCLIRWSPEWFLVHKCHPRLNREFQKKRTWIWNLIGISPHSSSRVDFPLIFSMTNFLS